MLLPGTDMNLKEYLFLHRKTVKEFGELLGYSRTHMSLIVNGKTKPSRAMAKSIERLTDGQVNAADLLEGKPPRRSRPRIDTEQQMRDVAKDEQE